MKSSKNSTKKIEYTNIFYVKRSQELLEFLLEKMNTSRNNIKTLLSKNQVSVNGSCVRQFNYMLAKEDVVRISKYPMPEYIDDFTTNNKKKKKEKDIDILYEDDNYIAIDKPYDMLSVEDDKGSLSAYYHIEKYLSSYDKTKRPYVIHRIDKETSGILVFAKNPKVQSILRLNWDDYVLKREYIAIVEGHMKEKEETITSYLIEDENNLMYVAKGHDGQKAVTKYEVLRENVAYSLLKVDIKTGRKNQIRVVLKSLSHPVVGDKKYNISGKDPIKRLGLHASLFSFKDPITNKIITIKSKTPSQFNSLFM